MYSKFRLAAAAAVVSAVVTAAASDEDYQDYYPKTSAVSASKTSVHYQAPPKVFSLYTM